ncbi:MAG: hypothetical protein KKD39_07855 [Candidatus Altiarchaeota archaeon]|nr:hypothetical protein [Candidatus Altiarchaeota archaeon]
MQTVTRRMSLNDGAVEVIANAISDKAKCGGCILVGFDGDKHVFKSTFSTAVTRLVDKNLKVKAIHADDYYSPGLWMDGYEVEKEGWNFGNLGRDIKKELGCGSWDVVVVDGFNLFNVESEGGFREGFDLRVHLKADERTREWVIASNGNDRDAAKLARENKQEYVKSPGYDYIVDTSIEFWRNVNPKVYELCIEMYGKAPIDAALVELPDGNIRDMGRPASKAEDRGHWLRDKGVYWVDAPVAEVVMYEPTYPVIAEVRLDSSSALVRDKLDDAFMSSRNYTDDGSYHVLSVRNNPESPNLVFGVARFDEMQKTGILNCDLMLVDQGDLKPGGPMDYWVKRRNQKIRINPLPGPTDVVDFDVVAVGGRLEAVRIGFRKNRG